jgi:hypothetical protein
MHLQTQTQTQVLIEPFEKWALDILGPIYPPSNNKVYILVCTNYVTKWVEAKTLPRATNKAVTYFLYEEIFSCFNVALDFIKDQGTKFTSNIIQSHTQQYHIRHNKSSQYHL